MLESGSFQIFHQRRRRPTYDNMLSDCCRASGPPTFCPAMKSSVASWARGKTWERIAWIRASRPPSAVRASSPRSLPISKASPHSPSRTRFTSTLLSFLSVFLVSLADVRDESFRRIDLRCGFIGCGGRWFGSPSFLIKANAPTSPTLPVVVVVDRLGRCTALSL